MSTQEPRPDAEHNELLSAALDYASRGWRVFPLRPRGKRPRIDGWPQRATTDREQIRSWWQRWPDANIAVTTGPGSGLLVLDIDDLKAARVLPHPGACLVAVTGRGAHFYYAWTPELDGLKTQGVNIRPGVDVRGRRGYVVAPPSLHASGKSYQWMQGRGPGDRELVPPPDQIIELLRGTSGAAKRPSVNSEWDIPAGGKDWARIEREGVEEGGRNEALAGLVGHLFAGGGDPAQVMERALAFGARCRPAMDEAEIERTVVSIARRELVECRGVVNPPASFDEIVAALRENPRVPEIGPLPDGLPPVPDFDLKLLPEALRPWIRDIAERIQCPPDYPAIGAMVALSAVVGRQVGVRPQQRTDWTVIPNLWGAIIGRPGLLKSPALAEVMRPLKHLEAQARKRFDAEKAEFEAAKMVDRAARKEREKDITKAIKAGRQEEASELARATIAAEQEAPRRRRYVTSDTTVEALGELLANNPRGVLVFRDELVGWLRDLDREGRESSRAFYLEAWNGDGGYTYDRIGRGTIDIEAATVSILGGIQPGPLSAYLRDAMTGGAGDDGLLQRLQLVAWPDAPLTWRDVDRSPDSEAHRQAWEVYERLDSIDLEAIGAEQSSDGPAYLRLTPGARGLFAEWRRQLELRLREKTEHPAFEAALAKYRSLVPTLALLIHLADAPKGGAVSEAAMHRALGWAQYLEAHARRLYAPALDSALHAARELDRHLRAGDLPNPFRARDVYRRGWQLLDRRGTEDALEYLADLGRVIRQDVETTGRPTTQWYLHPALQTAASDERQRSKPG